MKHGGFTLIELLIVLALLAVLAGAAAPSFTDLLGSQRRQAAAQELASGIRSARLTAVTRSQVITIHAIDADWSNGWRIITDLDGRGPDEKDVLLVERASGAKTRIVGNSKVAQYLSFDGLGGLRRAANGTLHVCVKDQPVSHYRIIVSITGRVRVEDTRTPHPPCA
ncbi:prepilin-type N-terminal cleavage/methylation domain-containing protein [Pseudomonas sp. v388]|uniref:GspH/FimT family protein n=1 Tax=Pseudomonas sp. v388 TaxID=2479849 RepID=UPI000F77C5E6|nr:GspH/FimT family protein [Pseudomonas sp. v388]RRV06159.1 prepilin-type N-terminal cleavage/methylation domain-containing protein [Pseudomonas sp. v388]